MRRLAWVCCGFCGGALAVVCGVPGMAGLGASAAVFAAGLLLVLLHKDWARRAVLLGLGLAVGIVWTAAWEQRNAAPWAPYEEATVSISACVLEESRETGYGCSAAVELRVDGKCCRAMLYGPPGAHWLPGDEITGQARLRRTGGTLGEDGLSYGARGYLMRAYLKKGAVVKPADSLPPRLWPAALAVKLKAQLKALLPAEECGYETALLSGDRSGLDDGLYDDLALSGTRHVVAVSGMHIGILVGALLLLFGSRRLTALLGLPLVWLFAMTVGMGHSVVRAAVMQTMLLAAPLFRRESDPPTTMLTALTILLLPNPRAILDVGLQLSFASVTGILLFSRKIFDALWETKLLQRLAGGPRLAAALTKTVVSGVAASFSVIPLTLPLSVLYFDLYSLASPLSNALIVPVIPACFALGLSAALLSLLWMPLGQVLAWPLRWLLRYCIGMTRAIAKLPYAAVSSHSGYLWIFLAGVGLAAAYLLLSRKRCRVIIPVSCLTGLFFWCLLLGALESDRAGLTAAMLDVGQGQCVCFRSGGHTALYDCGGSGSPAETAAQYLQGAGCRSVDILVLSHYDEDHAGGVARLLDRVRIQTLYLPAEPDEEGRQEEILLAAREHGCQVRFVTEDVSVPLGRAALDIYAPVAVGADNDACVAARCRLEDFDILLTGDMDAAMEKRLIWLHGLEEIEVLAAGHHGSGSSTGTGTLNRLQPETVLISVGEGNGYGHPSGQTLARLQERNIAVYRTDQCGTIIIRR